MNSFYTLSKKYLYFFTAFVIILMFFGGCSSGSDSADENSVDTGTLSVTHQLVGGVPENVDNVEFICLDANEKPVKDFDIKEKASLHVLEQIPVTTKFLHIKYHDLVPDASSNGAKDGFVGDAKAPVEIKAGQQTDVTMMANPTGKVYITGSNGQYNLMVEDKVFFMQGIGGDYSDTEFSYSYLNGSLQNSKVNTIRTYGVGDPNVTITAAKAALAQASKLTTDESHPVMVIVGLDLADAADPVGYSKQVFNGLINDTNADHILAWCISNEWVDLGNPSAPNNATVEEVSKWIQAQTPRTLTMVAIQNPGEGSLSVINTSMPSLDIIGINSFYGKFNSDWAGGGFLNELSGYIGKLGKPWCLTEYYTYDLPSAPFTGYKGMPYQTLNGGYNYFLELNSTSNAQNYADSWNNYVVGNKTNGCIGGCALNWDPPHNSQANAFWKQMFAYAGQWEIYVDWYTKYGVYRLQCVDAVISAYGGTPNVTPCPQIVLPTDNDPQGIECDFKADLNSAGRQVATDEELTASITATGTGNLQFTWYLVGGKAVLQNSGGIWEGPSYNTYEIWGTTQVTSIKLGNGTTTDLGGGKMKNTIKFYMHDPANPAKTAYPGNNYQLRVIVNDSNKGAATAAVGFSVKP